jgi:hypothetical protein
VTDGAPELAIKQWIAKSNHDALPMPNHLL